MGKFLPKEMITNILSRLPNESLWECKLVSKPWRDLIVYDQSFTHMHIQHRLQHHDPSPDKVNFIFQLPVPDEFHIPESVNRLYYAEFDKTNENFVRVKDLDLTHTEANNGVDYETLPTSPWGEEPWERPFNREVEHFEEIVGSCNGLVCVTLSYNVREELFYKPLYVCNPMTRDCVVLPKITVPIDDEDDDESCYSYDDDVELWEGNFDDGFGYSPATNEYKVVRIYLEEVYVYTLGDGKGWRHIGTKEECNKSGIGVYVHGAYNRLDKDRNLVSFDLEDEKFGVLPSPPCFRDWDEYSYQLSKDGECLSIIHESQRDVYEVWLLKKKELEDYESNKDEQDYQSWIWIKVYTLYDDRDALQKYNQRKPQPFAITKDSEVLFHDGRFFYRHDLNTRTSYPLLGFKKGSRRSICSATRHVNSFVSLKALGERDTTTMIQGNVVLKSLVPELTYNIEEEETCSKKRKGRTDGYQY